MSNVHQRNRSLSELEFYKNAVDLRKEVTRFLMNENHVPKRYRFVFTMPGIDLVRRLLEEITAANSIFPQKPDDALSLADEEKYNNERRRYEDDVAQRRYHQNEAIGLCEQTIQHFQWIKETLPTVSISSMKTIKELAVKEAVLLKAWRKQNKC